MIEFLKNSNKWVKASAFTLLGQFFHILHDCNQKNEYLLNEYCNQQIKMFVNISHLIKNLCEATFSFFVEIYGQENWPNLLKLLQKLVKNKKKRNLLDVVLIIQIILNIQYLWRDQMKWRIHHLIAKQIKHLVPFYSVDKIFQIIVPITLILCNDIVAFAFVRNKQPKKCILSCYLLIHKMKQVKFIIKVYRISHRFNQRQAYKILIYDQIWLYVFKINNLKRI